MGPGFARPLPAGRPGFGVGMKKSDMLLKPPHTRSSSELRPGLLRRSHGHHEGSDGHREGQFI